MNWKLFLNIMSSINGGLITGAALFNPLLGEGVALKLVSALGICQIIVSAVNSNLSTQANQVLDVQAMPGVERIRVNEKANPTLAALAVDPANTKIMPTPEAQAIITATANAKEP